VGERVGTEEVTVVAARKKRAMREPDRWSLRSGRAGRRNRQAPGPGLVGYVIGHVDQPLIEAGPEACWPRLGLIHSHGRRVGETGERLSTSTSRHGKKLSTSRVNQGEV
jgi:hypothetical protein